MQTTDIKKRKSDHIRIVLEESVNYQGVTTGFEKFRFVHNALPEVNFDEISTAANFLGYQLHQPLLISAMSGGLEQGRQLNIDLARAANNQKIALALGSFRPVLDDSASLDTFTAARENAPDIPIIANIGAAQLINGIRGKDLEKYMKTAGVDALAVHLNPLQELLQPEGDRNFRGISRALELLRDTISFPIIVKEVGFGLSPDVIERLAKIGIKWLDIAGAGGTSWSRVETCRITDPLESRIAGQFAEWGIPTALILRQCAGKNGVNFIASGGITTGLDYARSIALGAALAGGAAVFLKA